MSKRIFSGREADSLIVALLVNDLIGAINQPMRTRKVTVTLDYSHKDHLPRLYIRRPGVEDQAWMMTNTRTKVCYDCTLPNPDLQLFVNDVKERLAKLGGTLYLVAGKNKQGASEAKLQLSVSGSHNTALTLTRVRRGQAVQCEHFITPEGKVP